MKVKEIREQFKRLKREYYMKSVASEDSSSEKVWKKYKEKFLVLANMASKLGEEGQGLFIEITEYIKNQEYILMLELKIEDRKDKRIIKPLPKIADMMKQKIEYRKGKRIIKRLPRRADLMKKTRYSDILKKSRINSSKDDISKLGK